ncbi:MAG: tyrosine-type recombinase/integrase [bacterium]|nr:tyrosine-type recombinase/integrase [bacterium]
MKAVGKDRPIVEHILPFLDYCEVEKGLSSNTQKNYRQYLRLFVKWLVATGNKDLLPRELTAAHIWDYRLYLARIYLTPSGTCLTKKSQNYYLIALRVLLDFFAERDVEALPSSKIKLAKQGVEHSVTFLEMQEMERLLAVPDTTTPSGVRDRAILELFFSSGMRISELVSLNVGQVSFLTDKDPDRTYELPIIGKGRHPRTVFISPHAAAWVRAYLTVRHTARVQFAAGAAEPLFTNVRSRSGADKRLSPRYIQMQLSRYAMRAGLSKKVTPHALRHTYATDLLARGADLRSVQELLGHKNVATTQIYTHVTNKRLRDIHEKFHGGKDMKNE